MKVSMLRNPCSAMAAKSGCAVLLAAMCAAASLPVQSEPAPTTGLRASAMSLSSLEPRANRHALIIGISRYGDPATPELPGARIDRQSATQMAQAMQVPLGNIRYLQDEQATGNAIRQALQELTDQVEQGDRVFIHYSGHGTRFKDPQAGGCVEALLAYDGGASGTITNHEMADLLKAMTNKTDKLFVMYDACHSGGVVQAAASARTRNLGNADGEGKLRPKVSDISEECGRPVNIKTRSLATEAQASGALPQDIIHVSAARSNEISFDDELKGGLATQFMRNCMLRDAKDLDQSGAITMEEIRLCAQAKINKRLSNDPNFKAHNLVLNGNAAFVPAWFGHASASALTVPAGLAVSETPALAVPSAPSVAPVSAAVQAAPLTGEQALRQMYEQRDAKRRVQVLLSKDKLRIGQDVLDFAVQSDRSGFVYVAMAGSDNQALVLLFPNALDANNRIEAGQPLQLPRPAWRVKAGGPTGKDHLLVMVADGPRNLAALADAKAGPFVVSLNDTQGRAQLGALMSASQAANSPSCAKRAERQKNPSCSDAYGAAMVTIEETQ